VPVIIDNIQGEIISYAAPDSSTIITIDTSSLNIIKDSVEAKTDSVKPKKTLETDSSNCNTQIFY
jgi:hypothetical protein